MSNITYSSISEIHNALCQRVYTPQELYDYLTSNFFAYNAGEKVDKIRGSESDFHNLSVEFSRQACTPYAAVIAAIGVNEYPLSTDLLADQIKYSQESANAEQCASGIEKLKKIDRKYWGWRTFVFTIDLLKDGLSSAPDVQSFEKNLSEAKELIEDFKKYIPYDERAYVAEAEIYEKQGDYKKAIAALEGGIRNVMVAPQCCMKLADLNLKLGDYALVEHYARKGLLAATQEYPTISVGYLYYLLAMAMDARRIECRQLGKSIESIDVQKIVKAFITADKLLINEGRKNVSYRRTIQAKLIVIEMEEDISLSTDSLNDG